MKRRWPREVVGYERGYSPWLTGERAQVLLKQWTSRNKRRTHKRERREGRRQTTEDR